MIMDRDRHASEQPVRAEVKARGLEPSSFHSNVAAKDQILSSLDFPRRLVRGNIDQENCAHAGNFAPGDPVCEDCISRLECGWLYHNDEFSSLGEKPEAELVDALGFALDYVEAFSYRAGHRPGRHCPCELCTWLNGARALHRESGGVR